MTAVHADSMNYTQCPIDLYSQPEMQSTPHQISKSDSKVQLTQFALRRGPTTHKEMS